MDKNRNIETRMFLNILSLHYGEHWSKLRCIRRRENKGRTKGEQRENKGLGLSNVFKPANLQGAIGLIKSSDTLGYDVQSPSFIDICRAIVPRKSPIF